jgi:flagellar biosynthetic protein FliR
LIAGILAAAPLFLLLAVRALALIETAPLLSSESNPQIARVALAGFTAYAAFPSAQAMDASVLGGGAQLGVLSLNFLGLLVGEAIIGLIMGFFYTDNFFNLFNRRPVLFAANGLWRFGNL